MKLIQTMLFSGLMASAALAGNYGSAGCGLGSLVFGDDPGMIQIFAATTNGTSYSQTLGITTGTSNCTEDGVALEDRQLDYFTEANFESLLQEMAQGEGENLEAFSTLFGCSGENVKVFSVTMQKNYSNIESESSSLMLQSVKQLYSSEMGSCSDS